MSIYGVWLIEQRVAKLTSGCGRQVRRRMEADEPNIEMAALLKDDDRSPPQSIDGRTSSEYDFMEDGSPHLRERKLRRTVPEDDSLASFYKPVESYEGRHRYDPYFQWEPAAEKKVVRKVRIYIFGIIVMTL